jgi:hypothetical protein
VSKASIYNDEGSRTGTKHKNTHVLLSMRISVHNAHLFRIPVVWRRCTTYGILGIVRSPVSVDWTCRRADRDNTERRNPVIEQSTESAPTQHPTLHALCNSSETFNGSIQARSPYIIQPASEYVYFAEVLPGTGQMSSYAVHSACHRSQVPPKQ